MIFFFSFIFIKRRSVRKRKGREKKTKKYHKNMGLLSGAIHVATTTIISVKKTFSIFYLYRFVVQNHFVKITSCYYDYRNNHLYVWPFGEREHRLHTQEYTCCPSEHFMNRS